MVGTINKGEMIPLTFDIMFTEVFNNEDSICILEEFIAGYFNYPLESVRGNLEILSRRLPKENRIDSRKEVDLLLNLNGRKINIEMSNSKINESVQIVFNNYNCHDSLKKTYYLRDDDGNVLSKKLRIDIINLEKGKEICYTGNEYEDYLVSWCKILTEISENKLNDLSKQVLSNNSKNILMKKMNKLSGDDEMVRLYTKLSKRELEFNTLKEEVREEGFVEGRKEESRNIALNMLKEGISISTISKCTNLSEEEINKLK